MIQIIKKTDKILILKNLTLNNNFRIMILEIKVQLRFQECKEEEVLLFKK